MIEAATHRHDGRSGEGRRARRGLLAAATAISLLTLAACSGTTASSDGGGDGKGGIPGVTDSTVTIGIAYPPDTTSLNAAGQSVPSDPEIEAAARAVAAEYNAAGGILGRKIELVFEPFDLSGTFSSAFQGACAQFTEDHETFAVTTEFTREGLQLLQQCLSKKRTILAFDSPGIGMSQERAERYAPYFYNPAVVYYDRWGSLLDVAVAQGFVQRGAKVGIVQLDDPAVNAAMAAQIRPAIERAGGRVVADMRMAPVTAGDNFGQAAQQLGSAVLQFKSAGVDHVMFIGGAAAGPVVFMNSAAAQQFRPRYVFTSDNNPMYLAANAPVEQLGTAVGLGWSPATDVGDTIGSTTPGGAECFAILRKASIDFTKKPSPLVHVCDFVQFLKVVIEEAGSFEGEAIRSAYARIADTYKPASTFKVAPKPGRSDGVAEVRGLAFGADCRCFRYTTGALPLP